MIIIPNATTVGEAVCTNITILGDDIKEGNETFTITVLVISPDSIRGPNTTTITIVDDGDCKYCIYYMLISCTHQSIQQYKKKITRCRDSRLAKSIETR